MKKLAVIGVVVVALMFVLKPSSSQKADLGPALHQIPIGKKAPNEINAIVEIPRGSQNKYEIDKKLNLVRLDRVLQESYRYPGDYGMIPSTRGGDGDALDILIVNTEPLHPGVVVTVRPIGVLLMEDDGEADDKIIAVPVDDARFAKVFELGGLETSKREEIAEFFRAYKSPQGKWVKIGGWDGSEGARQVILEAMDQYDLQG